MSFELTNEIPTLEGYKSLRSAVGWKFVDDNSIMKGLHSSTYAIQAKSEGKTVGMGRIVGDGGMISLIVDIIVLPEYQGQGIGKAIVQTLLSWIQSHCAKNSTVWLFAADGRESFYEQLGFLKRPMEGYGSGMQWFWNNCDSDKT
jgi:GNAT superfamily N-acetyltransferase